MRDAPAARAGLRPGDVITSIDNRDIPTTAELAAHHLRAAGGHARRDRRGSRRRRADAAAVGGRPPADSAPRAARRASARRLRRRLARAVCDLGALQRQVGDLGRLRQAHRRAPVTGAAAHVDLRVAVAVQPRPEPLLQANEVPERPDLAAVRVSGDLQPDPERRRVQQRARLVREQDELALRVAARRARAPAPPRACRPP